MVIYEVHKGQTYNRRYQRDSSSLFWGISSESFLRCLFREYSCQNIFWYTVFKFKKILVSEILCILLLHGLKTSKRDSKIYTVFTPNTRDDP